MRFTPALIAYACALLPAMALVSSFLLSASLEYISWCIPLIEGCSSISRAARHGYSLYLFRSLIIPAAFLQVVFWYQLYRWFLEQALRIEAPPIETAESLRHEVAQSAKRIFILGLLSATFLVVYATFLGTEGTVYTFMRRLGIYVYFASTVTANLLLTVNLFRLEQSGLPTNQGFSRMLGISFLMLGFAVAQGYIKLFVEDHKRIENIIEWNIAIAMYLPFLVLGSVWSLSNKKETAKV